MRDHLQFMCHLRMVDYQAFTKRRMSSDLIINAPPFFLPEFGQKNNEDALVTA